MYTTAISSPASLNLLIPSLYKVDTFSSASKLTLPASGVTTKSPISYSLPYSSASNNPDDLTPSFPATSNASPGINVLLIENAIGWPGVSISKR